MNKSLNLFVVALAISIVFLAAVMNAQAVTSKGVTADTTPWVMQVIDKPLKATDNQSISQSGNREAPASSGGKAISGGVGTPYRIPQSDASSSSLGDEQQNTNPAPALQPQSQPAGVSAAASGLQADGSGSIAADRAPGIPASVAPSSVPSSLESEAEGVKMIRQLAKDNNIYIPESESDAGLWQKYALYVKKHESELAAKFNGRGTSDKETVDVLRQFSSEAYPKAELKPVVKPQVQSFFSKTRSFFKRIFG